MAVGDGSRAGDAIVVRYGDLDNYKVMLIDGGTSATGEAIVLHLRRYFGEDVELEHILLTHSDGDHASGLREVLKEIPTKNVWMHVPWLLAREVVHLFADPKWTADGLEKNIKGNYDILAEIFDLAVEANAKIFYPFEGSRVGPFTVMSPQKQVYLHLLPQFDKTPDPDKELIEGAGMWLGKANAITTLIEKTIAAVTSWVEETWVGERLKDGGVTSASNESSVVLYGNLGVGGGRILLTGDAGVNALRWAAEYATANGKPIQNFNFVQIPHHGSRRNVGPTALNTLIGPILPEGTEGKFEAFVSAPADDSKHPRLIVKNAFIRRGGRVITTAGSSKIYWGGFPKRAGYSTAVPEQFSAKVENYD
jgi:hypothetical protein